MLTIGGVKYEMRLGLAALNYLDGVYAINGANLGLGLSSVLAALGSYSVTGLVNMIKACTVTEAQKPSNKDIEAFIGDLSDEDFCNLYRDFFALARTAPLCRATIRRMEDDLMQLDAYRAGAQAASVTAQS